MEHPIDRRLRLAQSRLYLISAGGPGALAMVKAALAGGVDIVQLRDKCADDRELVATGRALRRACDAHNALLIVNDRPDIALECSADGVHLGQQDESVEAVRAAVGPALLIGISTHSPEQIARAEASAADYLGVGPVHGTPTKPHAEPVGAELVAHAAAATSKPFFAIGGIDATNAGEVIEAGATRIAVVRAIGDAADPRAAAARLSDALTRRLVGGTAQ
ncbi:MAG: hypothetical protein NVSMB25_03830 [Thermoleophilaceae bacterium]